MITTRLGSRLTYCKNDSEDCFSGFNDLVDIGGFDDLDDFKGFLKGSSSDNNANENYVDDDI